MITVKIYITPKLLKAMHDNQNFESAVLKSLSRFTSKDWGDLCREDKQWIRAYANTIEELTKIREYIKYILTFKN